MTWPFLCSMFVEFRVHLKNTSVSCITIDSSAKHTNAIAHATSRTTFGKMLFELLASVGPAGPPFKPLCPKCRAGSQSRWYFSHFRLYLVYSANMRRHALLVQCWLSNENDWPTLSQHWVNVLCLLGT